MIMLSDFFGKKRVLITVSSCALFMMCLMGCREAVKELSPQTVVITAAQQKNLPVYGSYIGMTEAYLDVEVRARVDGFLEEQLFVEGSVVQKGDLLYRIDNRSYQARVNRLKAKLASTEAALAKAGRDVKRIKPLYEQSAASQLDYDNALSNEEQERAAVAATRAELEEAELELSFTEIEAPITGLVGESLVDIGGLVGNRGQSLLTSVKQIDPIKVRFNMSALDYLNAQRRMKTMLERLEAETKGKALEGFIRITLPDETNYPYWGDITFTDPQVNPQTGTFAVRAILPNPKRELLPGQFTRVRITLDELPGAIVIPEQAMQIEQGGSNVMVVLSDNTVEQRFIVPGHRIEGEVVVDSGLSVGEQVIIEGMHLVHHGQKVIPLSREEYEKQKEQQKQDRLLPKEERGNNS